MLKAMWKKANAEDSFPFVEYGNLIDTKVLAIFYDFIKDNDVGTYNLGGLIKKFGLKKRGFHEGAEDVKATKDLLMKFVEEFK
jgi:DNA polymerase III alpha subunit (gram-positive type)